MNQWLDTVAFGPAVVYVQSPPPRNCPGRGGGVLGPFGDHP